MDMEITIRKASISDLKTICDLYNTAIQVMDDNNIHQWDTLYPNEDLLKDDILKNQMYIADIENQIASVFVLNQEYDTEYANGNWKYKDSAFTVVHRLCVNPRFQNQGVGTKTMQTLEKILQREGAESIRLDTFSQNPFALRMYEKLGYRRVGEANWRKGLFYLYEKKI